MHMVTYIRFIIIIIMIKLLYNNYNSNNNKHTYIHSVKMMLSVLEHSFPFLYLLTMNIF